jgi:hypothetical protein
MLRSAADAAELAQIAFSTGVLALLQSSADAGVAESTASKDVAMRFMRLVTGKSGAAKRP